MYIAAKKQLRVVIICVRAIPSKKLLICYNYKRRRVDAVQPTGIFMRNMDKKQQLYFALR